MLALLSPDHIRIAMGLAFFPTGLFSIISGLLILISGPYRQEAKILAEQSARISQKGLTDNINLVTQSATALVDAVNALIRTSSGNAIVLIIAGALLEAAAYWLMVMAK
jgi:hypothetical protein